MIPIHLFFAYLATLVVAQNHGVPNGCMICERWMGKDMERSGFRLF